MKKNLAICLHKQFCWFSNRKYFYPNSPIWQFDWRSTYWISLSFSSERGAARLGVKHKRGCCVTRHAMHVKQWSALSKVHLAELQALANSLKQIKLQPKHPELRLIIIALFQNITFGRTHQEWPLPELLSKIMKNVARTYSLNPIICLAMFIFMFDCMSCLWQGKLQETRFLLLEFIPAFLKKSLCICVAGHF